LGGQVKATLQGSHAGHHLEGLLGLALLTVYGFPNSDVEVVGDDELARDLNREFRCRTKTQASFGYRGCSDHGTRPIGRLRQIILRRVDRRRTIPAFLAKEWCQAA
jgi:hypothetical protein